MMLSLLAIRAAIPHGGCRGRIHKLCAVRPAEAEEDVGVFRKTLVGRHEGVAAGSLGS